jgi:hypothetical protein
MLIAPYSEKTRLFVSLMLHRLCVPAPPATAAAQPLALTAASQDSLIEAAEAAVVQAQADRAAAKAVAASAAAEYRAVQAEAAALEAAAAAGSDHDDHDDPFSPELQAALRESSATAAAAARTAAAAAAAVAEPNAAASSTAASGTAVTTATGAAGTSAAGAAAGGSSSDEHKQQDAADAHDGDDTELAVAAPAAVGVVDAYGMMEAAAHVLACAVARGAESGALQALALTARLWGGGSSDSGTAARGYAVSRGVGAFVCALLLREAEWLQRQEVSMTTPNAQAWILLLQASVVSVFSECGLCSKNTVLPITNTRVLRH